MSGKSNISKYFLSLVSFGTQAGFTLIELMVVVIMVGVLVAIGLPNVLSQAGKAREASAKNALSAVAMAQQAYFFERAEFANSLSALDLSPNITYYTITEPVLPNSMTVRHEAHGENSEQNNIRNYGVGIYGSSLNCVENEIIRVTSPQMIRVKSLLHKDSINP